jgi:hypothetical protein
MKKWDDIQAWWEIPTVECALLALGAINRKMRVGEQARQSPLHLPNGVWRVRFIV